MDRYSHKEFWFQFIEGIHLCTALLRSHHSFSIRMGFGLCWAYSVLDFQVCLGSLSCRMTQFGPSCSYETDLTFDPIILWYRKKFPIDSVTQRMGQLVPFFGCRAFPIITPPPPFLTFGMGGLFLPKMVRHLVLSHHCKRHFSRSLGIY